jgi:hypothetical protein
MVKICPECENPIIDTTKPFCPGCGTKLPLLLPEMKPFVPKVVVDEDNVHIDPDMHSEYLSKLHHDVLSKLYEVSKNTKQVVRVTSGYRPQDPLPPIPFKDPHLLSAHNYSIGVDIKIKDLNSEQIADELEKVHFQGIGVYYYHDGTLTNVAHGDLRGDINSISHGESVASIGTPYFNNPKVPVPWRWHYDITTNKPFVGSKEEGFKNKPDSTQPTPTPTPSPQTPVTTEPTPTPVPSRYDYHAEDQIPVTPPPQIADTPVVQSSKTATAGDTLKSIVKWTAICCGGAILLIIIASIIFGVIVPALNKPHITVEQQCQDMAQAEGMKSCGWCAQDRWASNNPNAGLCRFCSVGSTCSGDPCDEITCLSQQAGSQTISNDCSGKACYSPTCQAKYIAKYGWDYAERHNYGCT